MPSRMVGRDRRARRTGGASATLPAVMQGMQVMELYAVNTVNKVKKVNLSWLAIPEVQVLRCNRLDSWSQTRLCLQCH